MSDSPFTKLHTLDVNSRIKAIQGNRYLPWVEAWGELCKVYPDATYCFHENNDGLPYFESNAGLFVKVSVTVGELTHTMTRPVYDFRNLAMMIEPRQVKYGKKMVDVNGATANDINDSLMRCFTKAIAMFGLGLYVFQDRMYADAETIDAEQITEITTFASQNSINLVALNTAFKVSNVGEIHAYNFENAMNFMKETVNK